MREDRPVPPGVLDVNDVLTAYRLSWVANFMSGPLYKQIEAAHGLTRPEFIVLLNCHHQPGSTAREICMATGRPRNSISRAVIKLVAAGCLVQGSDDADSRRRPLRLTAKGSALYARLIPLFKDREARMLAVLSSADRAHLDRILRRLVKRDDGWAEEY